MLFVCYSQNFVCRILDFQHLKFGSRNFAKLSREILYRVAKKCVPVAGETLVVSCTRTLLYSHYRSKQKQCQKKEKYDIYLDIRVYFVGNTFIS